MYSIEWLVADSDLVVRGTIVKLEPQKGVEFNSDAGFLATVRVDETLKGPHQQELRFFILSIPRAGHLLDFQRDQKPLLIFLNASRELASKGTVFRPAENKIEWRFSREPFAPRSGYDEESILNLDSGGKVESFTTNLKPLVTGEEILSATRSAAKSEPRHGRLLPHMLSVQANLLKGLDLDTRSFSGWFGVTVPIDGRLEKIAQGWVKSPDPYLRLTSVECLAYFHTDQNIALLRSLTGDTATQLRTDPGGATHDSRFVGDAARFLLQCWGLPVKS